MNSKSKSNENEQEGPGPGGDLIAMTELDQQNQQATTKFVSSKASVIHGLEEKVRIL